MLACMCMSICKGDEQNKKRYPTQHIHLDFVARMAKNGIAFEFFCTVEFSLVMNLLGVRRSVGAHRRIDTLVL